MKSSQFPKRLVAFLLMLVLLCGIAPASFAVKAEKISVTELMKMFDSRVQKPKQSSILDEPESAKVRSKYGKLIYVYSRPLIGKKLFEAKEGAAVTVYARQSGYALGIVDGTSIGGWMKENNLAAVKKKTEKEPEKKQEEAETDQQKTDSLIAKGLQYELGDGEKQDYAKAAQCYEQAIKLGSPEAKARLGLLYMKDYGNYNRYGLAGYWPGPDFDPGKPERPFELLSEAAEENDPTALFVLGLLSENWSLYPNYLLYYDINSLFDIYASCNPQEDLRAWSDHDLDPAESYYERAYSAGNKEAEYALYDYYIYEPHDITEDGKEWKWLNDRADENDPYALFLLACFHENEDEDKAEAYFDIAEKEAVKQNESKVLALSCKRKMFALEEDSSPVHSEAIALFEKAAELGEAIDIIEIISALYRYDDGTGSENIYEMIRELAGTELKKGNADDLAYLGERLMANDSYVLAVECCLAAAEKGHYGGLMELENLLSVCLNELKKHPESGWITDNVPERLFKVVLEAADNEEYLFKNESIWYPGDGEDMIVWMYEEGFGTEKDPEKAEYWREKIEKYEEGSVS